jgi:hypothetical protein
MCTIWVIPDFEKEFPWVLRKFKPLWIGLHQKNVSEIRVFIVGWTTPKNVSEIRVFIGFVELYWRFIEGFFRIAFPLASVQKKRKEFEWTAKIKEGIWVDC